MATSMPEQVHQVVPQARTMGPYQEIQQAQVTVKVVLQEAQVLEEEVAMMELSPQIPTRIVKKIIPIMDLHSLATMMANISLPRLLPLLRLLPTAIPSRMVRPTALLRQDQMLPMGTVRLIIPIKAIQDNHSLNPLLLLHQLPQALMEAMERQIKMELAARERIAMRTLLQGLMLTLLETMLLQPLLQILAAQWTALSILTIQYAPTRISYLLDLQHHSLQHLNRQRQRRILPLLKVPLPPVVLKPAYQTALPLTNLQMAMATMVAMEMRARIPTRTLAVALLSLPHPSLLLSQHPLLFQTIAPGTKTHLVTMEVTAGLIQDLEVCLQTLRRRIVLMCLLPR